MQFELRINNRRGLTAALALLTFIFSSANCTASKKQASQEGQNPRQPATAQDAKKPAPIDAEKQRAAEEAIDRLQQRFYQTLDFGNIWKEMYVSDETLRHLEIEAIVFKYLDHNAKSAVSYEAKERAYVALGNFWHLSSAMKFTMRESDAEAASSEMENPYEDFTQHGKPVSTSTELDELFTGKIDKLNRILRKYLVKDEFNSPTYKTRLGQFHEEEPADPQHIREVFMPAGLKPETPIYVVDREVFHYYLIEEDGQFKLLTFLLRKRL